MRVFILITLSLYLLTGCVPKIEKTDTLTNSDVNNELKKDLGNFKSSNLSLEKNWWTKFNDEQLNRLLDEALNNTPSLNILKIRYEKAKSQLNITKALKEPTVSIGGNVSRQRYSENYIFPAPLGGNYYNLYEQALGLDYEFDFWDKNSSLIRAALNEAMAQKVYIRVKELAISTTIVKLYDTLNYQKSKLNKFEELKKDIIEKHHILAKLHELGLANKIEINTSATSLDRVNNEIFDTKIEIENLKNSLATIAGVMPSRIENLKKSNSFDNYKVFVPENIHLDILSHRPEIAMQKYLLLSKEDYIQNAKAQFYPNISLSGLLGFTSFSWASLFEKSSSVPYIGTAISLPLFDGHKREENLNVKVDDYNIQVQQYNQSIIEAVNEVVTSLKKLELNQSKLKIQKSVLENNKKNVEIQKRIYELGLKNKVSYIDSKIVLINDEIIKLALKNSEVNAHIDLIKAFGGGYENKGETFDNN
ncbi:efflux transporter outer membrane subunit [Halarcobacter ebronensis]|uniref:RND transporter n=1 Tax=Halarcobacter ebronensis TaxID=1462615 RepID=A0A4V1M0G3_9BACT|nr:TolC family protein [Halarcobacter ebronensis]QKF81574.1 putative fusaric acid resistance efflux pump, outer membrane protein [Halarcobacter ebronensis]RXK05502.1 hypothetical protein CRV07_08300 [Halarcobacter ebronensis]